MIKESLLNPDCCECGEAALINTMVKAELPIECTAAVAGLMNALLAYHHCPEFVWIKDRFLTGILNNHDVLLYKVLKMINQLTQNVIFC